MWRVFLIMALAALGLTACAEAETRVIQITATPEQPQQGGTLLNTANSENAPSLPPLTISQPSQLTPNGTSDEPEEPNADETPTPVIAPTSAPQRCDLMPDQNTRPKYKAEAVLSWAEHQAEVEAEISYINTTGIQHDNLVLWVETNRQLGFFILHEISVGDEVVTPLINATRLTIPLDNPLGLNCPITLKLRYTLRIPPIQSGYYGRFGYMGYTERQINLGHWIPTLALYQAEDWYTPRPHFVGEQGIPEASDFEASLRLIDAPESAKIIGPGRMILEGTNHWRFELEAARDLSISIGDNLRRANVIAENGTIIELYYFSQGSAAGLDPANQALKAAAESLVLFEELFGLRYPYSRLVIVEGDFPDGMEFSGLVYVGEAWFRNWNGNANSWLTVITVHEVAHQWWYLMVGSDPAEYPYLDEAFATYSEFLYFQRYYGELYDWWWNFRVRGYDITTGDVQSNVYAFDNARTYINAVYLRGAEMLHTMREELGDAAFFAWLKSYASNNLNQIAAPPDLWAALPQSAYQDSEPLRQRYFRNWDILSTSTPQATQPEIAQPESSPTAETD